MRLLRRVKFALLRFFGFALLSVLSVAFFTLLESKFGLGSVSRRRDENAPPEAAPFEANRAATSKVSSANALVPNVAAAPQSAPASTPSTLPIALQTLSEKAPALARTIQFGWRLFERWGMDKCPLMAAAMAFFALVSLFPTLLAALAIMGKVLSNRPEWREELLGFVGEFLPGEAGKILASGELQRIADAPGASTGVVSILLLLWSGRAFFDTLASVLNSIWYGAKPRTLLQHQLALWGTLLGAGALWLLSTGVTFGLTALRALVHQLPGFGEGTAISQLGVWNAVGRLISWLLTLLMFWLIYRFLPNAAPGHRGRRALGSALIAAVGWELAKWVFTSYLGSATKYGAVYGSVASVVLTLMWLYLSATIVLLAAEAVAAYEETKAAARGEAKPTKPHPDDEGAALPDSGAAAAPDAKIVAQPVSHGAAK